MDNFPSKSISIGWKKITDASFKAYMLILRKANSSFGHPSLRFHSKLCYLLDKRQGRPRMGIHQVRSLGSALLTQCCWSAFHPLYFYYLLYIQQIKVIKRIRRFRGMQVIFLEKELLRACSWLKKACVNWLLWRFLYQSHS